MNHGRSKKQIKGQSEAEVAHFWLSHDSTDYVDLNKMEMPNRERSPIIPVSVPDEEYERLRTIATEEKKSIGELVRQLVHNGLNNLPAHPLR